MGSVKTSWGWGFLSTLMMGHMLVLYSYTQTQNLPGVYIQLPVETSGMSITKEMSKEQEMSKKQEMSNMQEMSNKQKLSNMQEMSNTQDVRNEQEMRGKQKRMQSKKNENVYQYPNISTKDNSASKVEEHCQISEPSIDVDPKELSQSFLDYTVCHPSFFPLKINEIKAWIGQEREINIENQFTYPVQPLPDIFGGLSIPPYQFSAGGSQTQAAASNQSIIDRQLLEETSILVVFMSTDPNIHDRARVRKKVLRKFEESVPFRTRFIFVLPTFAESALNAKVKEEGRIYGDILQTEVPRNHPHLVPIQEMSVLGWIWLKAGKEGLPRYVILSKPSFNISPSLVTKLVKSEKYASNRVYGEIQIARRIPNRRKPRTPSTRRSSRRRKKEEQMESSAVEKYSWPWEVLPDYLSGYFRVFSSDTIPRLLLSGVDVPLVTPGEVWLTGLVAPAAGVVKVAVSAIKQS